MKINKQTTQMILKISLQSYTKEPIRETIYTIKRLKLSNSVKSIKLPTTKESFTVIRSAHVDKKSREQFKIATHKSVLFLKNVKIFKDNSIFKVLPSFRKHIFLNKNKEICSLLFNYFKRILNKVLPAGIKYVFTIDWFVETQKKYYTKIKNRYKRKRLKILRKIQRQIQLKNDYIDPKTLKKTSNIRLNYKIRILMRRLNSHK